MFKKNQFIKKNQLVCGKAYVWKDGSVRIYLGVGRNNNELYFYSVCSALFVISDDYKRIGLMHHITQLEALQLQCQKALLPPYDKRAFISYTTMPSIYGDIGQIYEMGDIHQWLQSQGIKNIDCTANMVSPKNAGYVSAKELVVGGIYYGGKDAWHNTWCYLGRTNSGGFMWCYIGNDEAFSCNPNSYILSYGKYNDMQVTQSNKKVRILTPSQNSKIAGSRVNISDDVKRYLAKYYNLKI